MDKYIVLHNSNSKESRDFVETLEGVTIISWYEDDIGKKEYASLNMPGPSTFPLVVDTENKLIVSGYQIWGDAIAALEALDAANKKRIAEEIFIAQGMNQILKGQRILAFIGATIDSIEGADIAAINEAFANVAMLLLTGSCSTAQMVIQAATIDGTGLSEQNRTDILNQF